MGDNAEKGLRIQLSPEEVQQAAKQKTYRLSNQAIMAIGLALQKTIQDQGKTNFLELVGDFELIDSAGGLMVTNAPVVGDVDDE